jgi:hypothetical protein
MCPHTAKNVSSYCHIYICVLTGTAIYASSYCYICVLILIYMCPPAAVYTLRTPSLPASRDSSDDVWHGDTYTHIYIHTYIHTYTPRTPSLPASRDSSDTVYTHVESLLFQHLATLPYFLILLYLCPLTAIYVSSYC